MKRVQTLCAVVILLSTILTLNAGVAGQSGPDSPRPQSGLANGDFERDKATWFPAHAAHNKQIYAFTSTPETTRARGSWPESPPPP